MDKLRLQKLLFLLSQEQSDPSYHFVPYKFGCFSFQATADLSTMCKFDLIKEHEKEWELNDNSNFVEKLVEEDKIRLRELSANFGSIKTDDLIRYTYVNYPFYAIKSVIADKYLTKEMQKKAKETYIADSHTTLFTNGYEGKSLEEFLNLLICNNISVLCDVRKNAFSMKFGFSKNQLKNACDNLGITYNHVPDLGIESRDRKNLETEEDYRILFKQYNNTVIARTKDLQKELITLIKKTHKIALMCFEKLPSMCHRSHLAAAIVALSGDTIPLNNL